MNSRTTDEPADVTPLDTRGHSALDMVLGLLGSVVGGASGYFLFVWIARQGFYAPMLPGACVGWGCGALSGRRSVPLAVVCAVLGLAAGIYGEWSIRPFTADGSLSYFLAHLHQLTPVTQIMILLGVVFAAWLGLGRSGGAWPRTRKPPDPRDNNPV